MSKMIYEDGRWGAEYEQDDDGADRVWIYRNREVIGTFESVDERLPIDLVNAVESFYEERMV